ncbi:metal ABC transporter permease [Solirubrobacter sp. CPCC 204708]|uniref:Metal ABC transporter permease n=1 Tax=Solirubrobacter deserti TaxID=2282478 RepID=A0ABT4RP69_9ACTN|nr:metal ABC transporter permease [Solirubrobacter deserti]MBE2315748.1 metal ABC transporter permease [Solirubrobacter deserti]MDA0140362.1 metal ABC transporter permease [Solirubrobacter deserti]
MLDALLEPWREPILRDALLEVVFVGLACGALGVWVVLLGRSYSAESLAHGMFPGLVVAALLGVPLVLGGAVGLIVAALAIAAGARLRSLGSNTAVAVVITSLLGIGTVFALSADSPPGLQNLLFGDVLATSPSDLALAAALAAAALIGSWLAYPYLLTYAFDPSAARSLGARPRVAEAAFALLLTAAVLVGVQALGNLLVVAALIGPAVAARTFTRRVPPLIAAASALGVACGVGGLYLSYYADVAAGAAIAGLLVTTAAIAALAKARLPTSDI